MSDHSRKAQDLEDALAVLHNLGATLVGNTQDSDLDWLARLLFEASRLGVGDVRTVPWIMSQQEWEYLGLTPQALVSNGPSRWDLLTVEQQYAWWRLARICFYILPHFAERVGHRFMAQARAIEGLWREERKRT